MSAWSRWLVGLAGLGAVALVACISLSLQAENSTWSGVAAQQGAGAGRFSLVAAPLGEKRQGVFIVDSQTLRLLVYSVEADARRLKLVAVRDISQDIRLAHYNNEPPLPEEIRRNVESGREGDGK